MPKIFIPQTFTKFTNNKSELILHGLSIGELIQELVEQYPHLKPYILTNRGDLHPHMTICCNGKKIHYPTEKTTPVEFHDTLTFLLPLVGG